MTLAEAIAIAKEIKGDAISGAWRQTSKREGEALEHLIRRCEADLARRTRQKNSRILRRVPQTATPSSTSLSPAAPRN